MTTAPANRTAARPANRATTPPPPLRWRIAAVAAAVFGAMTVFSAGSILFGPHHLRAAAGAVVDFVLWFNFLAGFAYVAAAWGLWRHRGWAAPLARAILGGTVLVALGFAIHALTGGAWAGRTVGALSLRIVFWAAIVLATRNRNGQAA